jgi:hypothetical protein
MKKNKYIDNFLNNMVKDLIVVKSFVESRIGKNGFADFEQKIIDEFNCFSHTLPDLKGRTNLINFRAGPVLLAIYRVLKKDYNYSESDANDFLKDVADQLVHYSCTNMNAVLKFAYNNVGKIRIFKYVMAGYFKYRDEEYGWKARIKKDNSYYLSADMLSCGLHKWLAVNNAPDLCKIACQADYTTMEYMPNLKLKREKTIANGDDVCSFRYIVNR